MYYRPVAVQRVSCPGLTTAAWLRLGVTDAIAVVDAAHARPYRRPPPLDEILAEMEARYALTATYVHPVSYAADEDGQVLLNRLTSFTNIRILAPAGYDGVSVNDPCDLRSDDGRAVVEIVDMGHTDIKLLLTPSAP